MVRLIIVSSKSTYSMLLVRGFETLKLHTSTRRTASPTGSRLGLDGVAATAPVHVTVIRKDIRNRKDTVTVTVAVGVGAELINIAESPVRRHQSLRDPLPWKPP